MSDTMKTDAAGKVLGDFQAIGDAARQTGEQARQAASGAFEQARAVAHDAQAQAASVAGTVGQQASAMAETQKANLAERLEDVARAVHKSGEQLEGHQDWVAHLVERGADELTALASTLRSNDLQSLLGDLGSLARRQPALFVGASMAAGFALARVGRLAVTAAAQTAPAQTPPEQMSTPAQAAAAPAPNPPAATLGAPATAPGGMPEVTSERN